MKLQIFNFTVQLEALSVQIYIPYFYFLNSIHDHSILGEIRRKSFQVICIELW